MVAKALRRSFVCAWMNKAPQTQFPDGMYDNAPAPCRLRNGAGVTNVTAIFASAEGTVVHAMPGYLDPASFLTHLDFALALHSELSDPGVSRERRAGLYAEAHRQAAKRTEIDLEQGAHMLMANRFMRVDEWPTKFFIPLGPPT